MTNENEQRSPDVPPGACPAMCGECNRPCGCGDKARDNASLAALVQSAADTIAQLRADLARVTAERDEARAAGRVEGRADVGKYANAIGRIESALGYAGARSMTETVQAVERLVHERDAMRAVVEAADDFAGVCDADIHPAALPLKRRLLAALAALYGAR